MKPTISNAFTFQDEPGGAQHDDVTAPLQAAGHGAGNAHDAGDSIEPAAGSAPVSSLSSMEADIREAEFGWSLELSPMQAIDALAALAGMASQSQRLSYLVTIEQSGWCSKQEELPLSVIASRLSIPHAPCVAPDTVVVDAAGLQDLVNFCESSRLLIVAVDGIIEDRDATAIGKAVERGQSPLLIELRAAWAMEVVDNRSLVLHARSKSAAHAVVASNFTHYLAAVLNQPEHRLAAPEPWQVERLLDITGSLTVRPIETQVLSTSVDVGISSSRERHSQPADRSMIYDRPSNSWHDEP